MAFDPKEPRDLAVWKAVREGSRANLRRELATVIREASSALVSLETDGSVINSDLRRLVATATEAAKYAAEVNILDAVRPESDMIDRGSRRTLADIDAAKQAFARGAGS